MNSQGTFSNASMLVNPNDPVTESARHNDLIVELFLLGCDHADLRAVYTAVLLLHITVSVLH